MRKKKLIEENTALKGLLTIMSSHASKLGRDLREANATIKQMTVDREDQCEHAYFNGVGDTTKRFKKELSDAKQDLREMTQERDILVNTEARLERKIGELNQEANNQGFVISRNVESLNALRAEVRALQESLAVCKQERESLARRLKRHENPTMKQFLEVEEERGLLRSTPLSSKEARNEMSKDDFCTETYKGFDMLPLIVKDAERALKEVVTLASTLEAIKEHIKGAVANEVVDVIESAVPEINKDGKVELFLEGKGLESGIVAECPLDGCEKKEG